MIEDSIKKGFKIGLISSIPIILVYFIFEIFIINSYRYSNGIPIKIFIIYSLFLLIIILISGSYLGYIFDKDNYPWLKNITSYTIISTLFFGLIYQPLTSGDPFPDFYYLHIGDWIDLLVLIIGVTAFISTNLFFLRNSLTSKKFYIPYIFSIISPWPLIISVGEYIGYGGIIIFPMLIIIQVLLTSYYSIILFKKKRSSS